MISSLVTSLRLCAKKKDLGHGIRLHVYIRSNRLLEKDTLLGETLVSMYAKCGAISKAQQVLEGMPVRTAISWNELIVGYTRLLRGREALWCFQRMQSEGLSPNAITYSSVLKACGIVRELDMGKKIHDKIVSQHLLKKDIVLGNALVDMYAKCGALARARQVVDELPRRNAVSWNALIAGYARQGQSKESLECFLRMQSEGLTPDTVTYSCILKACGIARDVDMGERIHDEIVSRGLLEKNVMLGTALIDMYAKCGVLIRAQKVLEQLCVRDVVSWSALIGGYVQQGQGMEALHCYHRMRSEGLFPDAVTYSCILKACGITQEADSGKTIDEEIVSKGLLKKDVVLATALVDMYAKCGVLCKAQKIHDGLHIHNVVSWSALVAGYAQHGQAKEAFNCFKQMQAEGITPNIITWNALIGGYAQQGLVKEALDCVEWMHLEGTCPDAITFVHMLNACNHAGLVDDGQTYFQMMEEMYGIVPDKEHHTCMVDLFGRARHLDKAIGVSKMFFSEHPPIRSALLGACQKLENFELGRLAFEHAVNLNGCDKHHMSHWQTFMQLRR